MEIPVSIDIIFEHNAVKETFHYFKSAKWTDETEKLLLQHVHELLTSIKSSTNSLKIDFEVAVNDMAEANFRIAKSIERCPLRKRQMLSVRENEVLSLIAQGFTNTEIARKLFISFETVKSHRKNILVKSQAKNTASLINHYYQP